MDALPPCSRSQSMPTRRRSARSRFRRGRDGRTRGPVAPGSAGTRVQASDVVKTGADGSVGITMSDNSLLSPGPNSILSLDRFEFDSTTHRGAFDASLRKGSLAVVSGRIAKQSPDAMTVRTPSAVLGVRGTEFVVGANERRPLRLVDALASSRWRALAWRVRGPRERSCCCPGTTAGNAAVVVTERRHQVVLAQPYAAAELTTAGRGRLPVERRGGPGAVRRGARRAAVPSDPVHALFRRGQGRIHRRVRRIVETALRRDRAAARARHRGHRPYRQRRQRCVQRRAGAPARRSRTRGADPPRHRAREHRGRGPRQARAGDADAATALPSRAIGGSRSSCAEPRSAIALAATCHSRERRLRSTGAVPAQRQDREVVRGVGAAGESVDVGAQPLDDRARRRLRSSVRRADRVDALPAVHRACAILRFGHAIGEEAQELAAAHPVARAAVGESSIAHSGGPSPSSMTLAASSPG